MSFVQFMGVLRLLIGAGFGTTLATALHLDPSSVDGIASATSPGQLIVGALGLAGTAAWSFYGNRAVGLINKAISATGGHDNVGGPPSPIVAVKAAALARVGHPTHLSPNG